MSKALSNQLKLLRKSRSALAAGDLEEYERLNAEATAEVEEEEEEVSLEPTDTEPVVEEESSEVVSSPLPPVEPPSTTSLEPIPEILPHGAIPGAGSPTFVELAEMSGEGHFMTAFAHLRDFVLENAHEGAERAGTPLKERNLESTLGAAENVGIAGAIASTGHPVAAAAVAVASLYPAALTLSNEVFGTDFGSGGTGFGGDPLDPTQWVGGVVFPRTIAQNGQDDKDRKILRLFPEDSPEFRAATERLKVTELSDIIANVVQLNNPGEVASGYTNDRAYEADFLNAAGQMGESEHKVKTLKMGLDLASANEAIKDRFSDVLKRDEIRDLYYQTDFQGRFGESGVNISGPIEQLTAATMDRIRKENPRISAEELRERADKHVDTEVKLALRSHPFAEGIAIINIGDNDAIKELHEMEDRWGASYGELGRVAAQTLAPLYASMTSAPMTQRMGLMSPEQVSTESSLVSGARLTNLAPTTWWGAGAKFGYYPVVGPLLAKMGLIDPEDAVLSEEALAWMSEGGDIIDAAPQAARAFYDHLYPDAAPGSDSWNAMTAKFQKDHPFWSQAPVLAAAMIFEPDALSVMLAGTGKAVKLAKVSAKSIKYTKYIDNIDGHILPQLEEIAARLEPYSVKSTDAKGEAVYSHKDVPVELEDELGQAIQALTDSALKAAGDDPELQAFFQTNLLGRLKGSTGEAVRANWQTSVTARRALSELKGKSAKDTDDALQAAGLELRALEAGGKAADGILDISTTKLRMVVESLRDVMPEFFEGNNLNVAAVKNLSRKGLQKQIERATRETQESAKAVETVVHNNSAAMAAETVMFARLQKQKALLEQAHDIAKRGLGVGDEVEVITGGALDAGKFVEYKDVDGVKRAFVRIETEEGSVVKHYAIKDVAFDLHGVIRKLNPAHGARTSAAGLRFRDLARASFFKETEGAYTAADGSIWVPASSLGSLKEGQTVRWLDNGELQSVDEMTVRSTHTLKDGTETATIFAGKKAKPGMTVAVDLDQVYVLRHRDAGGQLEGILSLLEARARASTMHRGEEVTEEAINAWYARNFKGFATDLKGEVKPLVAGDDVAAQGDVLDDIMYQANALRRKTETLKRFGIFPERRQPRTREVGSALQERTREKYGTIGRNDFSEDAEKKIAKWLVEEVKYGLTDPASPASGAGWYTTAFQQALDGFGAYFPELLKFDPKENPNLVKAGIKSEEGARNFLTALIAVTSDGQKVKQNLKLGLRLYQELRNTGTIPKGTVSIPRQVPLELNIELLLSLLKEHGGKGLETHLLEEFTVKQLKKMSDDPKADFGYEVGFNLPRSAAILGPKLGAFYANLRGVTGYVTMDRWWNRTINRYRGNILPSVTKKSMDDLRGLLQKHYKTKKNFSDDEVLIEATKFRNIYKDSDYLDKTDLNVKSNTIWKNAFESLNDSPKGKRDRTFMTKAAKRARNSLKRQGIDLSLADIQAVIWYYEKRLYGEMGARYSGDLNYQDAAATLAQEMEEAGDIGKLLLQKAETPAVPVKPSADTQLLGGVVDMTPEKPSLREQVAAELENLTRNPATAGAATAEEAVEAARLWKELGTESPYFKKWFGDSKAVDFFGKPLAVFHGTSRGGFTEFAREEGIHFFTRDRGQASTYAYGDAPIDLSEGRRKKRQRGIYDVYLKLKNPLEVDYGDRAWDVPRMHDFGKGPEEFNNVEDLAEGAREAGYDGVIARNIIDYGEFKTKAVDEAVDQTKPTTEYLVFDNTNIKSTANRGTFDETGRILYQGEDVVSPAKSWDEIEQKPVDFGKATASDVAAQIRKDVSGTKVASYIADNADSPVHRRIAERIKPFLKDTEVYVINNWRDVPKKFETLIDDYNAKSREGRVKASGDRQLINTINAFQLHPSRLNSITYGLTVSRAESRINDIILRGENTVLNGVGSEVILHELVHAATVRRIEDGRYKVNKGSKLGDATDRLIALNDTLVDRLNKMYRRGEGELPPGLTIEEVGRWLGDPNELVAYGLTNAKFQEYLKTVKLDKTSDKSLWSAFVETLADLLGLKGSDEVNALEELLQATDDLLEAPLKGLEKRSLTQLISKSEAPASVDDIVKVLFQDGDEGVTARIKELDLPSVRAYADFEVVSPKSRDRIKDVLPEKKARLVDVTDSFEAGKKVGVRLDIPTYTRTQREWDSIKGTTDQAEHDVVTFVATVHDRATKDPQTLDIGKAIGYAPGASLKNVSFTVNPKSALGVLEGKPKSTFASANGEWVPRTAEELTADAKRAFELSKEEGSEWVQVGMNPQRHQYFFTRDAAQRPVLEAEEVIQIGPLVLAKKPKYGKAEDFLYQDDAAPKVNKAAVQFVEDNKAILYAFEQADVSSLLHEIAHVFRRDLLRSGWQGKLDSDVLVRAFTTKDDRHIGDTVTFDGGEGVGWTDLTKAGKTRTPEEMDKIQGKRSRKRKAALDKRARGLEAQSGPATWTVKSEERFARAFEKYLATGKSPSLELDGVFKKFKSWMTEIYVKIRGSAIGRDVPKEVREVFDRMLTGAMTTEGYMKTFTKNQMMSMLDSKGIVYKSKELKESLAKRLSAADRNRTVDYQKFLDRQKSTAERIATLAPAQAKLVKSLEDELKPLEAKSNKAQKALLKGREKFNKALNRRNTAKRKLILRNVYDEQKSGEKVVLSTQDALIKFRGNPTAKAADHLTKQLAKIDKGNKRISGNNLLAGVEGSIKDLKVMIEVLKKEQMVRPVRRNLMTHPILKSVIRDRTKGTWVIDPKAFVDSVDEFYVSGVLEEFLATPEGLFLVPIVTAARQGNVKLTYTKAQMNRLQKTLKAMEGQYRAGDLSREAMGRFLQMKMSYQNPTAKSIRVPVPFSDMLGGKGVLVGVPGSATKRFWHFYNVFDPTYSKLGKISPKIAKIASKQTRFVEHGLGDMHNLNMTHMGEDFLGAHVGYMDSTKAIKGRYGSTTVNTMGNGIFKEAQNFIMSNIKLTKKGRATFAEDDAGQYTKSLINALERTFLGNPELKLQPRISEAQATKLRSKVLELLGDESMTYDKFLRELGKAAGRSDFGRQDARGIMMSSRALLDAAGWQHTLRAMANTTNAMLTPQEALTMTRFMEGEMDKASDVDLLWSAAAKLGMDLSEGTIRAGTKHGQGERARVKSLVKWNLDDGRTLTPEELVAHNTKLEATLKEKGVSPEDIEAQLIVSGQKITDPRQVFMPSQIGDSMKDSNRSFVKELDQYYSNPKGFDPQGSLAKFVRYWKGMITSGLGLPRPKYYVNNILGDFSQMWQNHGIYTSAKVSAQNALTNMPYIGPRIQNVTSKMAEKFEGIPILSTAVEAIFSPQIGRIFTGEEGVIKLGDETISLSTLRENLALDGVLDTFTSREVSVNVNQVAMELLGDAEKKYGRSIPGKFKDIVGRKMKHDVDGFAVQVQQRQRVGLYLELRKQGLDHDGAVKGVKDALYDWSQGFSSWEQSWQMGLVIPFYRFWRLAAGQMIRAFMEPFVMDSSDYMLKALTGQTQLARMKTQGRILAGIPKWAAYAEAEEAPEGEEDEVFWDGILAKPWWMRPGMTYTGKQATQRQKDFLLGDHDRDIDTVATAMSAPMTAAEMYTIGTYILTTPLAAAAAAMDEDKEFNGLRSYKQLEKFAVDIGGPLVEALLKEKRTSKTGYRRISPGQESALKLLGDAADVHRDEDGRLVADEWALAFVNNLPVIGSQWADGVNGMEWSKLYYEDEELFDRILYMLGHISGPVRDYPSSTDDTLSFAHKDVIKHLKTAADKQKVGDDPKEKYKRMNE